MILQVALVSLDPERFPNLRPTAALDFSELSAIADSQSCNRERHISSPRLLEAGIYILEGFGSSRSELIRVYLLSGDLESDRALPLQII